MKKSLSQRIARFLEVINYFLLIPTSIVEMLFLFFGFGALASGQFGLFFYCLIITAIYCFGGLLLVGYYKHSRGRLSNQTSILLWFGTLALNIIPFLWMLAVGINSGFNLQDSMAEIWFYNVFGFYSSVILMAGIALGDDLRRAYQ